MDDDLKIPEPLVDVALDERKESQQTQEQGKFCRKEG